MRPEEEEVDLGWDGMTATIARPPKLHSPGAVLMPRTAHLARFREIRNTFIALLILYYVRSRKETSLAVND